MKNMKNCIKCIWILTFFLFSCNKKERNDKVEQIKDSNEMQIDTTSQISNNVIRTNDTIVDDNFVMKFIEDDLVLDNFKDNFKKSEIKISKNKFDETVNDTTVYYRNLKDSLLLYKTVEKSMITYFSIKDRNILLLKTFNKIGVNKNDYLNYFKLKDINDELFITDTEQGNLIGLKFKKNKLIGIVYSMTYLD